MRITALALSLLASFLCLSPAAAQPGDLDDSFGDGGIVQTNVWGETTPYQIKVLANGDMLLAGTRVTFIADLNHTRVIRLTSDGEWIETFGGNGEIFLEAPGGHWLTPHSIIEQPDGKIIIGFNRSGQATGSRQLLLRITANGMPDPTFGVDGFLETPWNDQIVFMHDMALDDQGRLVVVGLTSQSFGGGSATDAVVMRFLPNGDVDGSFGNEGQYIPALSYAISRFTTVRILPDGGILTAGLHEDLWDDELAETLVLRLLPDGAPDMGFGQAGIAVHGLNEEHLLIPEKVIVHTDGRIILGGLWYYLGDTYSARTGSLGLLSDGTRDTAYGADGYAMIEAGAQWGEDQYPVATFEDEDGAMLYLMQLYNDQSSQYHHFLARQLANGQADEVFGTGGLKEFPLPQGTYLSPTGDQLPDGKFVTTGSRYIAGVGLMTVIPRLQPTATFASVPEQSPFLSGLSLFPNPVADRFTLTFQHEGDGPLRIELMDLQGRLVRRFAERVFVQGEQRLELAWPADAAQGAYHLLIHGRHGRAAVPLVR